MSSINPTSVARQLSVSDTAAERNRSQLRLDEAQLREQLTTGKEINRPSDDPGGFDRARKLDAATDELAQYERSIGASRQWVNATERSVSSIQESFVQAREKGLQAANDTVSESDRSAIADELRSIRDTVINELNTQVGDEYIFAGNATLEAPFDEEGNLQNGDYGTIDGERTRAIGPDETLQINVTGEEIHKLGEDADNNGDTVSIIDALDSLIDAVDPNVNLDEDSPNPIDTGDIDPVFDDDPEDTTEAIQNGLQAVEAARDHVNSIGSEVGATAQRLDAAEDSLQDVSLELENRRSDLEDADFAEAITELENRQTRLQAALQVTSQTNDLSLLNFI